MADYVDLTGKLVTLSGYTTSMRDWEVDETDDFDVAAYNSFKRHLVDETVFTVTSQEVAGMDYWNIKPVAEDQHISDMFGVGIAGCELTAV
jgi:hypothetical protein